MNALDPSTVTILPFQPGDQDMARELILSGLVEHWGWLDFSKNRDLDDIASSYAHGIFLVAHYQGVLVGTGAMVPRQDGLAEIVRMSVAREVRRKGIGSLILQRLLEQARMDGYRRVILETTTTWQEVIDFYLRFGFRITHYAEEDVYFALDL